VTIADRVDEAVQAALKIPGWQSDAELRYLAERAATCHTMLEIGSWQGRSSKAMAAALPPDGVLYCIDDWRGEQATPVDPHELRSAFMRHLLPEIMAGKVIQYTIRSAAFAHMLRVGWIDCIGAFDCVFVDGSHLYEDVCQDIADYWPLVKAGCVLCGHDFQLPEVKRAVTHMRPEARCVAGSIWEAVKPT